MPLLLLFLFFPESGFVEITVHIFFNSSSGLAIRCTVPYKSLKHRNNEIKDDILNSPFLAITQTCLALKAADEAGVLDDLLLGLLLGPQVREGVDDHTEDEVEHDDDHDEVEEHVVDDPTEIYWDLSSCEGLTRWVFFLLRLHS